MEPTHAASKPDGRSLRVHRRPEMRATWTPSPRAWPGRSAATCRDRRAQARGRASARRGAAARAPATARGARPRGRRAIRRPDRCARTARGVLAAGAGGLVIVTGEAGIGKTRLAARFAAGVHRDGGAVLCGHADEETVWPYQPFVEALRHYVAHRRDTVSEARRAVPRRERVGIRCSQSSRRLSAPPTPARAFVAAISSSRPSSGSCCMPHAQRGCCSSSRTCTGPTPRPPCCCDTSCAAARDRACSWSRRSTTVSRPGVTRWPNSEQAN